MSEVQTKEKLKNMEAIIKECRSRGITIDDLLELILTKLKEKSDDQDILTSKKDIEIEEYISNLFIEIGIPANTMGYRYLRYAIIYVYNHPESMNMVTKVLYPAVAKKFNTTGSKAERAMRHAIERAWERGDRAILEEVLGYTISMAEKKPTNSEFIAIIVEKL